LCFACYFSFVGRLSSSRCSLGCPCFCYLFVLSPAVLCPLEPRRLRWLRLCHSLLLLEQSGTTFQWRWPLRTSGNPIPSRTFGNCSDHCYWTQVWLHRRPVK
uniref:Uncharacterized protein n=1 Tax=Castor canadensis TaxID=51338 RepID=A0A8C0VXT5_CASCN